jgi:hypothetical protein
MNTNLSPVPKATFLTYVLLAYSFSALFIIPYGTFPYARVFIPMIIAVFALELIDGKVTITLTDILLSIGILLTNIIPELSLSRFSDAITIIILLFKCKELVALNRTFLTIIYFLAMITTIYHISFSRFSGDENTIILNSPDPNFSGFLALSLFLFCYKNKFLLGILVCLACVFLLWSRNYFLALIVFFILLLLENFAPNFFKNIYKKASIVKIALVFIFLNLIILSYSLYHVEKNKSPVSLGILRSDPNRFFAVVDDSNWYRFNANKEFFELLKDDQEVMLFGASFAEPVTIQPIRTENQDENYNDLKDLFAHRVPPHNTIFHLILIRGVLFSLCYLLGFTFILKRLYSFENFKYLFPLLIFGLFLHSIYSGVFIIFIVSILSMPEQDKFLIFRNSLSEVN